MRFLVTGSTGFIGSHLTRRLGLEGHRVFPVDIVNSEESVDIVDFGRLESVFDSARPDCVVHLAALASVVDCEENPSKAILTNVVGTSNLVYLAKKCSAHLILASSAAVYGAATRLPSRESDETIPSNVYGATKLSAERIAMLHQWTTVFRIFNAYGPECMRSYVIPDIIRMALKQDKIVLQGTGQEARDFIFVDDVVSFIVSAAKERRFGIFNIGTGRITCIADLATKILGIIGKTVEVKFQGVKRKADFEINQAATGHLRETFPRVRITTLEDGLIPTIRWYSINNSIV